MARMNPASRRNILFIAAVAFLLIAGYLDPGIVHRLACHVGIITAALLGVRATSLPTKADPTPGVDLTGSAF